MHFAFGMAVDKVDAAGEAGVLINCNFAHDGVFDDVEFAGGEGVRQEEVDGTGEVIFAESVTPFGDLDAAFGGGVGHFLNADGVFG